MKRKIKINGKVHGYFEVYNGRDLPIILYLHGGPGSPEYPIFQSKLESTYLEQFNVIYYEHAGCGLSFSNNASNNLFSLIDDVKMLAEWFIKTYRVKKIILIGHSFGSFIGIEAVKKYPYLFYFYVGISQVLDVKQSEEYIYTYLEKTCLVHKDLKNLRKLQNEKKKNDFPTIKYISTVKAKITQKYHIGLTKKKMEKNFLLKSLIFFSGYSILEKVNYMRGLMKSSKILLPQLLESNELFNETKFIIPIYFIHGKYDYQVSGELVNTFLKQIDCSQKNLFIFNKSAHFPNIEEPHKFNHLIRKLSDEIVFEK